MTEAKDSYSFQEVFIREREEMSIFHVHSEKKHATRFDVNYSFSEEDHEKGKTRAVKFSNHCTVTNYINHYLINLVDANHTDTQSH